MIKYLKEEELDCLWKLKSVQCSSGTLLFNSPPTWIVENPNFIIWGLLTARSDWMFPLPRRNGNIRPSLTSLFMCSFVAFKGHSYPNGTLIMADPQSHIILTVIWVEKSLTCIHEIMLCFFMTTGWDGFFHMWARLDPGGNRTVKHAEIMALTINTADGPYFRWTNNSELTVLVSAENISD